jgi:DNA-binding SARP family transcriptional activator/Tfp pilus assembly protein PilF
VVGGVRSDPGPDPPPPQVRVLGPVEVTGPGGAAVLVGARQRAVVGLLALNPGTPVPQWRLVDGVWGDDPPRTAVKSLHSHIARVRQALDGCGLPGALVTREPGYRLAVDPDAIDAGRFETITRQGREALARGEAGRAAALLGEALALWRGELALADAEPRGWGAAEVDRLGEARLAAAEDRWEAELRLGRPAPAARELERLLVRHPLRERLVGLLMLARYRSGRYADALATYQRLRARLADQLGVDPGPALIRLHAQILRRDPDLDRLDRPDPAAGPAGPGRPDRTPEPAGPGTAAPAAPAQLPAPVGHFTGRGRQLAALDRLLAGPGSGSRIAVISGLAGIGKTALAVQWAHRVAGRFPDGQLFLDLRGHEPESALTPAAALAHLLRALGVPADRLPADPDEQAGLYRSLLHGQRILVVLDNAGTAETVLPLVPAGEGNLLLVTSRRALAALTTHHAVTAVGLDALASQEAVALLRDVLSPRRVDREPGPAAELVRLCGRMPLALRIAAAKLVTQPGQSLQGLVTALAGEDRLDALSVEGDSRSVRTVFASAYRALRPPPARLFRLLGLHPGPTFTTRLAAALAELPAAGAERTVAELAAAHLVAETGPGRYRFHDLIGLFARQCAAVDEPEPERAAAVARLVDWYLGTAYAANRIIDPGRDRVTPTLRYPVTDPPFGPDHRAALGFLDGERGNLLPVVRYAAEHGHPTAAWQLTYLLTGYYDSRGHWSERVEMCRWGVAAAQRTSDPATEGLMRSGLGLALNACRRFDDALASLSAALPLMRAAGDRRGEGHVHNNIAMVYTELRRFDEAIAALRRALARHTAAGHQLGVALAHYNLGHIRVRQRRAERGIAHFADALAISRRVGSPRFEASILVGLGEANLQLGNYQQALGYYQQALAMRRRIGDRRIEPDTLCDLGTAYLRWGDFAAARSHFRQALAASREIADPHAEAVALANLGRAQLGLGELGAAREHLERALALRVRVPDRYAQAQVLQHLGDLEHRSGNPASAEHHWRRAVQLYRSANATDEANLLAAHALRTGPARSLPITARATVPDGELGPADPDATG